MALYGMSEIDLSGDMTMGGEDEETLYSNMVAEWNTLGDLNEPGEPDEDILNQPD